MGRSRSTDQGARYLKVQELLNKDNWIRGTNARDKYNNSINARSLEACKWCLWGAVIRCYEKSTFTITEKIEKKVGNTITGWNDDVFRIYEDVEDLIKELDI